jgi:hypothetical protein
MTAAGGKFSQPDDVFPGGGQAVARRRDRALKFGQAVAKTHLDFASAQIYNPASW